MAKEKFDFEAFVRQAGEQLRAGKPFTGTEGVFTSTHQTNSGSIPGGRAR